MPMENKNPAQREAEKNLVGAILSGNVKPSEIGLNGTEFESLEFRNIYLACAEIENLGNDIEVLAVSNLLQSEKTTSYIPPTPQALANLSNDNVFDVRPSIKLIKQHHSRKKLSHLFQIASENILDASENPIDVVNSVEENLNEIRRMLGIETTTIRHVSEIAVEALKIYEEMRDGISQTIPTGIKPLDIATGGGSPGDVWVIGAFTGQGKSALALHIAKNQSELGFKSLIINREMLDIENFKRLHSSVGNVPLWTVRPNMNISTYDRLIETLPDVSKQNIYIDSTSADMPSIARSIREAVKNYGVKIVFVDYLQLLRSSKNKNSNRADEVAYCSRMLKEVAMETETLIISLAQYNRNASYAGKAENHSFAESSGIEKDASIVLHLELEKTDLAPGDKPPTWRKADIRIGKARNAPISEIGIWFRGETFSFTNDSEYPLN